MGVTTSFFIATFEELQAHAPGWVVPEYGPCEVREGINPFTKEPMTITSRPLLTPTPESCPPHTIDELIPTERSYAWKLSVHELPLLMKLLGVSDEDAKRLGDQALIGPDDQENYVSEVPTPFVQALASLSAERIPAVASDWAEELEWETPPTPLLKQLVEVASEAIAAQKRMFTYVAL